MTTLITGAAGYLAGHLAAELRSMSAAPLIGADVRAPASRLFDRCIVADLTDARATERLLESIQAQVIYHLAGVASGPPEAMHASNVETTRQLLMAARVTARGARIVVAGSAAEYGAVPVHEQPVRETHEAAPLSEYGRAKHAAAQLAFAAAREHGQHACVARPFNVIGPSVPDALVAGALISRIRAAVTAPAARAVTVGRTDSIRDFVDVRDVARALARIASHGRPGEAYNVCTGRGKSVAQLLELLLSFAPERLEIRQDPALVRQADVDSMVGSPDKAERDLGWRAQLSFEQSVRSAWDAAMNPAPS